jgi:hypothetical protein
MQRRRRPRARAAYIGKQQNKVHKGADSKERMRSWLLSACGSTEGSILHFYINQSIDQSINQSINQSIKYSTYSPAAEPIFRLRFPWSGVGAATTIENIVNY